MEIIWLAGMGALQLIPDVGKETRSWRKFLDRNSWRGEAGGEQSGPIEFDQRPK